MTPRFTDRRTVSESIVRMTALNGVSKYYTYNGDGFRVMIIDDKVVQINKMDAEFSTPDGAEKKSTNYLSIPLNLRYQIGLGDLLSAYIATGPQWNVLLSGKSWSIDDATNAGAKLKSSNFSWNVGVGIMALTHLQLGVTYNIPISKSGEAYFPVGSDLKSVRLKNNTWQIRAAYFF